MLFGRKDSPFHENHRGAITVLREEEKQTSKKLSEGEVEGFGV